MASITTVEGSDIIIFEFLIISIEFELGKSTLSMLLSLNLFIK